MTPVTLALKDLAYSASPGVVVQRANEKFNMIEFDCGHDDVRCANTGGTVVVCRENSLTECENTEYMCGYLKV
jgi:hypothetical protein